MNIAAKVGLMTVLAYASLNVCVGASAISYVDENGEMSSCSEYTRVTSATTTWTTGWYVVDDTVSLSSSSITISGNVKLILCDGCNLSVSAESGCAGIVLHKNNTLSIYSQAGGTGILVSTGGHYAAGIGGNNGKAAGILKIYGGNVTANGGEDGAGIGGGFYNGAGGTVVIAGGVVTANGGSYGAGIGTGYFSDPICNGGIITITGGSVLAKGGSSAAGIGGGYCCNGGTVTVTGGSVTAIGGSAAGIGGGVCWESHGTLKVSTNRTVRAGTDSEDLEITRADDSGKITLDGRPYYTIVQKVPTDDDEEPSGLVWKYVVSNGKAEIVNSGSSAISVYTTGAVTVPSSLDGYPVTKIGYRAFYGCNNLTSIDIPEGIREIGGYAFERCKLVQFITIPSTVTKIGTYAFLNCQSLQSIVIPDGITELEDKLFANCYSLESVKLPSGLKKIGQGVFDCCGMSDLLIPDGVESIDYMAFARTSIHTVNIPDSVTNMGWGVFYAANNISIKMPNNLGSITAYMFWNMDSLKEVTLSSCVSNIGEKAFFSCDNLGTIRINVRSNDELNSTNQIRLLAESAGANVDNIKFVEMMSVSYDGNGGLVEDVSSRVERGTSLPALPNASKEGYTFVGWFADDEPTPVDQQMSVESNIVLKAKWLPGVWKYVVNDGEATIVSTNGGCAVSPAPTGDVEIPAYLGGAQVVAIGREALYGCDNVTSLIIPEGIRHIGETAFDGCDALSVVTIPPSVVQIDTNAFVNCHSLCETRSYTVSDLVNVGALLKLSGFDTTDMTFIPKIPCAVFTNYVTRIDNVLGAIPCGCSFTNIIYFSGMCGSASVDRVAYAVGFPYSVLPDATREGCTFAGWYTEMDGGDLVTCSTQVSSETKTLYARWVHSTTDFFAQWAPNRYSIEFHANGGSGVMDSQLFVYDAAQILNSNKFTRIEYAFTGWSTNLSGSIVYRDLAVVSNLTTEAGWAVGLFANWQKMPELSADDVEDWVIDYLAPSFVKDGETESSYRKRFRAMFGNDYSAALLKETGKTTPDGLRLCVWHDYIAGTDPTDMESMFAATIEIDDGCPRISYSPILSEEQTALRAYKIFGKKQLRDAEWVELDGDTSGYNFFKVTVELK